MHLVCACTTVCSTGCATSVSIVELFLQEARFTAAQLEQQRERLAIALAARDRADAECAAAKAERAAAERDREAADKVLDEFVTRINELEQQQQDNPLPLAHLDAHAHAPPTPAAPAPAGAAPGPVPAAAEPAAEEAAKGDGPMDADGWAGADATAAAAPPARPSRDPRMAARSSRGALELPPWVATGGPSADHGSTLHPPPCPPSATEGHHLDADDPAPSPLLEAPHAAVAQSPALEQEITDFFPTNCATATGHPPPDARCALQPLLLAHYHVPLPCSPFETTALGMPFIAGLCCTICMLAVGRWDGRLHLLALILETGVVRIRSLLTFGSLVGWQVLAVPQVGDATLPGSGGAAPLAH